MKFIADSMLGRLARWLRLLGYDTLYFSQIEDRLLLKIAREEDRVLLTKDTRIVKVRGLRNFLLLTDNDPFVQLKEVVKSFHLKTDREKSNSIEHRCVLCNAVLEDIPRNEARGAVPEYVYQNSRIFRKCQDCVKLYWDGTHPGKFRKKLSEVLQG
jgi:uncharacterized protein with PIN domain